MSVSRSFWIGVLVVCAAAAVRFPQLPVMGHGADLKHHQVESDYIIEHGLFHMYNCPCDINHPPIGVGLFAGSLWVMDRLGGDIVTFEGNGWLMAALKLTALAFELALIALVYWLVEQRAGIGWAALSGLALALIPGFVTVTALWGQTDSIFVFFLVLTLALMQRDRPVWAWAVYGLAWLAKFQSVLLLPLLVVLTLRRTGWRTWIRCALAFGGVFGGWMLPFVLFSGADALFPYTGGAVDWFPHITNDAYNMWFWLTGADPGSQTSDAGILALGLSYNRVGTLLLAAATALICLRVWLLPDRDDEFLVAAVAGAAFFNLPTQIHSRYLYPALVFLVIAMARNWRLVLLFGVMALAFSFNVYKTLWLGGPLTHYPTQIFVWNATQSAAAITVASALLFGFMLYPVWLSTMRAQFGILLLKEGDAGKPRRHYG